MRLAPRLDGAARARDAAASAGAMLSGVKRARGRGYRLACLGGGLRAEPDQGVRRSACKVHAPAQKLSARRHCARA
eukprot:scaffold4252_cov376-Prasinococcus_capsulatus_cf.AAC.1